MDINVPIACGDVAVFPGDILVGDNDGVIVIPFDIIGEVTEECLEMTVFEEFVMEKVSQCKKGLYPLTDTSIKAMFEKWKKDKV